MARYIGPKSRIARRFGEAIFGEDKVHPDNTALTVVRKTLSMVLSSLRSRKLNTPMVYSSVSSVFSSPKLLVPKVLPVRS